MSASVGVGIIGMGFMGRTHAAAYEAAAGAGHLCHLAAVCDPDPARLTGASTASGNLSASGPRFDLPRHAGRYTKPADLLADPGVKLVSICTYTDTHVPLAIEALRAGKHVLVEKPVALASRDVAKLAAEAAASGRICMPAMCMRFWPGWDWLPEAIRDGRYGAARSATFQRLGAGPTWGAHFYRDFARSGGALIDLHIHDVDFIAWCFGVPSRVMAAGSLSHVTTLYTIPGGPGHVTAEGGWSFLPGVAFRMRYTVCFERATADFDLSRSSPLVVHEETGASAVPVSGVGGYDAEIRHMVDLVSGREAAPRATLDEAVRVAAILEAERRSIETGLAQDV